MEEPPPQPGGCAGLVVLFALGVLIVVGLAANGRTFLQCLVAIGFGAVMLGFAWLCAWTRRRALPWRALSGGQRAWQLLVFAAWTTGMAVLLAWYAADHAERTQRRLPAANPAGLREEPAADVGPLVQPQHNAGDAP
jgi:hypothetical protein